MTVEPTIKQAEGGFCEGLEEGGRFHKILKRKTEFCTLKKWNYELHFPYFYISVIVIPLIMMDFAFH